MDQKHGFCKRFAKRKIYGLKTMDFVTYVWIL